VDGFQARTVLPYSNHVQLPSSHLERQLADFAAAFG